MLTALLVVIAVLLLVVIFLILSLVEAGNRNRGFQNALKNREDQINRERENYARQRDEWWDREQELKQRLERFKGWEPRDAA